MSKVQGYLGQTAAQPCEVNMFGDPCIATPFVHKSKITQETLQPDFG
jgi:hypothetical protein